MSRARAARPVVRSWAARTPRRFSSARCDVQPLERSVVLLLAIPAVQFLAQAVAGAFPIGRVRRSPPRPPAAAPTPRACAAPRPRGIWPSERYSAKRVARESFFGAVQQREETAARRIGPRRARACNAPEFPRGAGLPSPAADAAPASAAGWRSRRTERPAPRADPARDLDALQRLAGSREDCDAAVFVARWHGSRLENR